MLSRTDGSSSSPQNHGAAPGGVPASGATGSSSSRPSARRRRGNNTNSNNNNNNNNNDTHASSEQSASSPASFSDAVDNRALHNRHISSPRPAAEHAAAASALDAVDRLFGSMRASSSSSASSMASTNAGSDESSFPTAMTDDDDDDEEDQEEEEEEEEEEPNAHNSPRSSSKKLLKKDIWLRDVRARAAARTRPSTPNVARNTDAAPAHTRSATGERSGRTSLNTNTPSHGNQPPALDVEVLGEHSHDDGEKEEELDDVGHNDDNMRYSPRRQQQQQRRSSADVAAAKPGNMHTASFARLIDIAKKGGRSAPTAPKNQEVPAAARSAGRAKARFGAKTVKDDQQQQQQQQRSSSSISRLMQYTRRSAGKTTFQRPGTRADPATGDDDISGRYEDEEEGVYVGEDKEREDDKVEKQVDSGIDSADEFKFRGASNGVVREKRKQRYIATRRASGRPRVSRSRPLEWPPLTQEEISQVRSVSAPLDDIGSQLRIDRISDCAKCFGSGLSTCRVCMGAGWVDPLPMDAKKRKHLRYDTSLWDRPDLVLDPHGAAQCPYCVGIGKEMCSTCLGSGSNLKKGFNIEDRYRVFDMFQGGDGDDFGDEFDEEELLFGSDNGIDSDDEEDEEEEEYSIYRGPADGFETSLGVGLNLPGLERSPIERDSSGDAAVIDDIDDQQSVDDTADQLMSSMNEMDFAGDSEALLSDDSVGDLDDELEDADEAEMDESGMQDADVEDDEVVGDEDEDEDDFLVPTTDILDSEDDDLDDLADESPEEDEAESADADDDDEDDEIIIQEAITDDSDDVEDEDFDDDEPNGDILF